MEMTLDQFERLQSLVTTIRDEAGETRIEMALLRQEMVYVREHLAKLNGRVGKAEDRMGSLETAAIEARGAWKAAVAMASLIGGLISSLIAKLLP
jgi:predicted  nucleic acid-binding Zn-ribbon protein